jgi:hypothetical protein
VLDRPGTPERTLALRPDGYDWPIAGISERHIHLAFVTTTEPAALDPTSQTVSAWTGTGLAGGRTYPLTFNRTYPAGGGAGNTATIHSNGDLAIRPLLRFYGPNTGPVAIITPPSGPAFRVGFLSTFVLGVGQYVEVDTAKKTASMSGDPAQSRLSSLEWATISWPVLQPGVDNFLSAGGSSTGAQTQVQEVWNDRYLT